MGRHRAPKHHPQGVAPWARQGSPAAGLSLLSTVAPHGGAAREGGGDCPGNAVSPRTKAEGRAP
ncbi:hypothetical protein CRG98_021306 [Punica granatum]|uniref:Uncharacterized protein n=1 Tax=Punica granatum TaxID=22663 RepID=A0A2I0JQW6_PUNGR|nr:hypothetical protein CRG98_021306 [Punica granatum]